jgi:hypothetical protein
MRWEVLLQKWRVLMEFVRCPKHKMSQNSRCGPRLPIKEHSEKSSGIMSSAYENWVLVLAIP